MKMVLTSDKRVLNRDAVVVSKCEFPSSSQCKSPGKVPQLTGDAVEPVWCETVLNRRDFSEPETSGGLDGSGNTENSNVVFDCRPQCSVCGRRFAFACWLRKHMQSHTGEKPFSCNFCDKKFRTKYQQRMHERRHKGELPQCPVCGGRYILLAKHMMIHSTDSYEHVCSVCKRAFREARYLKKHMLIHTDERPYTCQDCGRRCRTSTHLKVHINGVHLREKLQKKHVCSVCGTYVANLKDHIVRIHTNVRPYHCETCDKAFKTKATLAIHRTVHSSEKPFVCSTCGKRFRVDTLLKRHIMIHSGEQPYECSVCRMRFNQSNSMQRHMLTHTGEQPYSCSDCGKRFTQCGGLASHRLRHCPERRNTHT